MEDQNCAGPQKAKGQLDQLLKIIGDDVSGLSTLSLSHDLESQKLIFSKGELNLKEGASCCTLNWVKQLSKEHKKFSQTNFNYLEDSRKSYSGFRKKLHTQLKNIDKNSEDHNKVYEYFIEDQYRELYNIIHNLQSLPNFLLTLDTFKSYSTCQIVAHEKGNTFASSNYYSTNGKTYSKRIDIEIFNKSFQSIKKSKSRFFQAGQLPEGFSEVIGQFQARTFTSTRYNLVLILGRNDFLPPNQDEVDKFETVTSHLAPILNAILLRSGQDDKNLSTIDLLENLPLPICIKDRGETYLFKNIAFENIKESEIKGFDKVEHTLTGKNTLSLYFDKELSEDTDLYHFYRVTLLGELLNTLRHELSNPLFGLSLATDILETDDKDEEIAETISDIKSNAQRCQTIIKNFSTLYEDEDNFKEVDLIKIIQETIILTKSATKGIRKEIIKDIDSLMVFSNPTWISQIIFNLIINSGQALKEKFGENLRESLIEVEVESTKHSILIHVRDNGAGIPESIQDKLFNTFFTTKDNGTGLGLSICKNLIHKLDGDITYNNRKEGGAQFSLSLPFEQL